MAVGTMIAALCEAPYSAQELAELSGLTIQTVRHYLNTLKKVGAVHIAEWHEDPHGARSIRAYMVGNNPDAKKPQPISSKVASAKYRAKMKQIKLMQQMTGQNI